MALLRRFFPHAVGPHPLFDDEFFVAVMRVELARYADRHHAVSRIAPRRRAAFEQFSSQIHRLDRKGQDDFFFVGKVVVDRSFGVLHLGSDPVHAQGLKPFAHQDRLSDPQDLPGPPFNFPLLPRHFDHGVNY